MAFDKITEQVLIDNGHMSIAGDEMPDVWNEAERKAFMDKLARKVAEYLNNALDKLNSTAVGNSGADNIGSAEFVGITSKNIRGQLIQLKGIIDEVVQTGVADGSLGKIKFTDWSSDVMSALLSGFTLPEESAMVSSLDSLSQALGKIQKQLNETETKFARKGIFKNLYITSTGFAENLPTDANPQFTLTADSTSEYLVFDIASDLNLNIPFSNNDILLLNLAMWQSFVDVAPLTLRARVYVMKGAIKSYMSNYSTSILPQSAETIYKYSDMKITLDQISEGSIVSLTESDKLGIELYVKFASDTPKTLRIYSNSTNPSYLEAQANNIRIGASQIDNKAVTTEKINDKAVTSAQIADSIMTEINKAATALAATVTLATQIDGKLDKSGGAMTGHIELPSTPQPGSYYAARLIDVQAAAQGLVHKESVRVATTINIALNALQTIDGVLIESGDRILVKNQTDKAQNGIYVAAAGGWGRAADALTSPDLNRARTLVNEGTVQTGHIYVCDVSGADFIWTLFDKTIPVKIDAGAGINATKIETNNYEISVADSGITETMVAPNAVTSGKIADGAVETGKVFNGAITPEKTSFMPTTTVENNIFTADASGNIKDSGFMVDQSATLTNDTTTVPNSKQVADEVQGLALEISSLETNKAPKENPVFTGTIFKNMQGELRYIGEKEFSNTITNDQIDIVFTQTPNTDTMLNMEVVITGAFIDVHAEGVLKYKYAGYSSSAYPIILANVLEAGTKISENICLGAMVVDRTAGTIKIPIIKRPESLRNRFQVFVNLLPSPALIYPFTSITLGNVYISETNNYVMPRVSSQNKSLAYTTELYTETVINSGLTNGQSVSYANLAAFDLIRCEMYTVGVSKIYPEGTINCDVKEFSPSRLSYETDGLQKWIAATQAEYAAGVPISIATTFPYNQTGFLNYLNSNYPASAQPANAVAGGYSSDPEIGGHTSYYAKIGNNISYGGISFEGNSDKGYLRRSSSTNCTFTAPTAVTGKTWYLKITGVII